MAESNVVNLRLIENTCDEPEANLMPIEDYQHSALVSLEIAAESIKSFFRNLPHDVWIAKNASKKPADKLTSDESAAIHLYTMEIKDQPLYSLLNKLLCDHDRRKLKPWFSYLKLFLTALFKLPSCSTKVIWRGVKGDLHSKYHRGEHYTWWSFSSCTLSLEMLEQPMYLGTSGERTLFSIECLNGKNIKTHSHYQTEDEILLLPGFYFEVVNKVKAGNDLHIIHLQEAVPPYILLEPPFVIPQSSSKTSNASIIDSILNRVYELNKDNDEMLKLFIVLPNSSTKWDPTNLFVNEYVLHFICECSVDEMHFASCPAFAVPNPRVFFQIYGNYIKQFMIPLARHLLDHCVIDKYHDNQFWDTYDNDLDKMLHVLDVVEHESVTVTKASNTFKLKELIIPLGMSNYPLYRLITTDMSILWVCINHYPIDQLNLIHELDNIPEVSLNINQSYLRFTDEIDSSKISYVSDVIERGLRLHKINLSRIGGSVSALQQFTRTLNQSSLMSLLYSLCVNEKADDEKLRIQVLLKGCNEIIASNPRIKHVIIDVNGKDLVKNNGMIDALKQNRNVCSLHHTLPMTDNDISQLTTVLENNDMFTTLVLSGVKLTSEGVKLIAELIRSSRILIYVTLSSTDIMDEGMKMIADAISFNPKMTKLSVSRNKLSDKSALFIVNLLHTCSSLTDLDVSSNKFTVIGAQLFFKELQKNQTLLHFNIQHNNLSLHHARNITKSNNLTVGVGELISQMLLKNTTLFTLNIGNIQLIDDDLAPLAKALVQNRTLAHIKLSEDKDSSTLSKLITDVLHWTCSLIQLDLSFNTLYEVDVEKLSEILQKSSTLHFLNLDWCEIGDNGMSVLSHVLRNNYTLTHLNLMSNNLTNIGAKDLADVLRFNTNLIYLDISFNQINDDGMKSIARALSTDCSLIYLDISKNHITDVGAQYLADALKSNYTLLHLVIIFNNELSSTALTKLRSIRCTLNIT